ncbi:MAG: hypothetical protein GX061_01470 [Eubacteriaceae bacterium]|nr:hypothetical protein [Eubacteriaceae bacterium]
MEKLSLEDFLRLKNIVYRSARPLEYTKWKMLFENGDCGEYLSVLASYQNEDGGFGHNLECNNWNPASSPYTVCIALDYLDFIPDYIGKVKDMLIAGIIKYLSSGEYLSQEGWAGMRGIPTNNDHAHLPWFHYDPKSAADVGVTKRLADFALSHADKNSALYERAAQLKEKYKDSPLILLGGLPDFDPTALKMKDFDPAVWPQWLPLPIYYISSPQSPNYRGLEKTAQANLDTIIASLRNTKDIQRAAEEELEAFELANPRDDGKKWCTPEQAIGNYYWGAFYIIRDLDILRKYGRLDFELPLING